MSRNASALFGAGGLDEVALYGRALTPAEVAAALRSSRVEQSRPTASFSPAPTRSQTGIPVSFDASASTDPDGTIAKYEWDLDGNGSYETNTGTTPTTSQHLRHPGDVTVGLRVTDNGGDTGDRHAGT